MVWKRKLSWITLAGVATATLLLVTGYMALRSRPLHRYFLAQIQKQASEATGAQVKIQDFALHLSDLAVDAYGITVHGGEPVAGRPLVQADQLSIRLKIVSLLHRKVDLNEIVLRHPVVHLMVSKEGTTNLPSPPRTSKKSTSPFDLGVQHVLLDHGEIYYNDVKTPLNAELHDLQIEVRSALAGKNYDGTISYRNGRVQYGNARPLPHDLTASFKANPSEFTLKPLVLRVASSTIEFDGALENYSRPSIRASYKITIHPQDIRPVLRQAALQSENVPSGEITLAGAIGYQHQDNVPLLRAVVIEGRLNGRELAVNSGDVQSAVRNVRGGFKLANGNLDVHGLGADLLGGHLTAVAAIRNLDTNSSGQLHASLQSISLDEAHAASKTAKVKPIPLHGNISGTAEGSWAGSAKSIKARSDIILKAGLRSASAGSKPIPLDGEFHMTYDGRSNLATITNTFLRTPQTRVGLRGTAGHTLGLTAQAHAADLREIDSLVAAFQNMGAPAAKNASRKPINFAGAADLEVRIEGRLRDPQVYGQLTGRNLQVENTEWRSLGLSFQASKSAVSLHNGSLVNARQGYINFGLSCGLSDWEYSPSNPATVELKSQALAVSSLLQLARLDYPVYGDLSMNLSMSGSQKNPQGSGSVRLARARIYGQPFQQLAVQFNGRGDTLTSTLNASTLAGSAKAKVVYYLRTKGYGLEFDTPGIELAQVQTLKEKNLGIGGVLHITANGHGTLDDPQMTATVQIPQLQIREASVSGIKANLNVAKQKAELALDSEVAQTLIQARGTVDLTGAHYVRGTFDTKGIPIERLLALYTPVKTDGPKGILEVHASAEGPLNDTARMRAQILIPTLKAEYQGLLIGNAQPIRIHYANSIVALDPMEFDGTDTNLRLRGQVPLQGDAAVTLAASGSIDMRLLQFFQRDLQSGGKLRLDLRGTGSTVHPIVQGQVRFENVSMVPADAPVGLQNVNGVLDVSNDRINVTQLAGEAGGGQISAHGVIGYRPQLQMNLALQAKNVRLRYQDQIRSVLEGDLNLVGTSQAANVNGRVVIDSLSFTSNFDMASFAGQVQSGPESTPSEGMANKIKLNIGVQTSRDMNLTSSAVSLQGQANLRIVGTAADPVIVGRTEFTAGDIFLMNQRYRIERGTIEFSNPNRTEPVLNVLLTSTINQYNLSLTFRGPLDKLQTNYVSDPPLPTADIINLIARGQTTEQAAAAPSNLGATSLLARGAASQVSGGIQKLAGLSSLSIDPTLGGNNSDPSARMAMQKRVTNNFLFTFATDVTSAQREIIQGEYKINKAWSASVTRDENGGFAVDGKYRKRY
jgi:translocation and assembly module TamB